VIAGPVAASRPTTPAAITTAALVTAGLLLAAWAALTWLFWVGYVGADDVFYARYAHLLHRPPINWWEFRTPYIAAIRGSFSLFGVSEFAAALPTLLASLAIAASAAWLAATDGARDWKPWAAAALAITMPIDIGYRTVPGAPLFSAGLLAAGTACFLSKRGHVRLIGSLLLACAFLAYELSFFYVAILCLTALALDARRFAGAVVVCVALSAAAFAAECVAYDHLLGDPFARYRTAAGTTRELPAGYDPDTGISGVAFYAWPLRNLVVSKHFAFDLALLLAAGIVAFRGLRLEQRILALTTLLIFLWLGYGTQVPWAYKPLYRQYHYYAPVTLGVASLLPAALASATRRPRALVAFCLLSHLTMMALGGRYGQHFEVSRELLRYASSRPGSWFLTDVATMDAMYVVGGFRLPANVLCANGPAVEHHLLLNKEPAGTPRWRFPERPVNAILLNLEGELTRMSDADYDALLKRHASEPRRTVVPTKLRVVLKPLRFLFGSGPPPNAMVLSLGGAVIELP
jgi:hypothetical protein